MAKLYFRYGTVASAKTLNLLAVAHNYRKQNKKIMLIKPSLDSRYGESLIRSRSGMEAEADYTVADDTVFGHPGEYDEAGDEAREFGASYGDTAAEKEDPRAGDGGGPSGGGGQSGPNKAISLGSKNTKVIDVRQLDGLYCILVDEAQFLSEAFVNQLHNISVSHNIPVICYGLRTDFRRRAFPGSARLMEIADTIEEIKTICAFCEKKAIFNLKFAYGLATLEGPVVDLGADEKYQPVCKGCYADQLRGPTDGGGYAEDIGNPYNDSGSYDEEDASE